MIVLVLYMAAVSARVKPVYDPDRPDGRLNLTASAFNQLGQYTSSPGRRGYCYAELAVLFPSRNHRQYSKGQKRGMSSHATDLSVYAKSSSSSSSSEG